MTGLDHRDPALSRKPETVIVGFSCNEDITPLGNQLLLVTNIDEKTQAAPWQSDSADHTIGISCMRNPDMLHSHACLDPFDQSSKRTRCNFVHLCQPFRGDWLPEIKQFRERV